MIEKQKINLTLLQRCIYRSVRQSAATRVEYNRESTDRQYKFINRPCGLDWPKTQVKIIDEDSAKAGARTEQPSGFIIITAELGLGQAGRILSIEVSRVARNNTNWYRLPDPCRLIEILLCDKVHLICDRLPLKVQLCEVLGWMHRHGSPHLILLLSEANRSRISAFWTDLIEGNPKTISSTNSQPPSDAIAIIYHLLHARKIMDALLCKLNSSKQEFKKTSKEESKRAKTTGTLACITGTITAPTDLGDPQPPNTKRYYIRSGQTDQQNGLCAGQGATP